MSIIYEALKKVERQGKQQGQPVQLKDKSQAAQRVPGLFLVSGVVAAVVLFAIWYSPKVFKALRHDAGVGIKDRQGGEETPALPALPAAPTAPNYTLEGIIYNQDNPLAIINGLILKKQEKIDDWEVINITPNEVEMMNTRDKTICKLGL